MKTSGYVMKLLSVKQSVHDKYKIKRELESERCPELLKPARLTTDVSFHERQQSLNDASDQ